MNWLQHIAGAHTSRLQKKRQFFSIFKSVNNLIVCKTRLRKLWDFISWFIIIFKDLLYQLPQYDGGIWHDRIYLTSRYSNFLRHQSICILSISCRVLYFLQYLYHTYCLYIFLLYGVYLPVCVHIDGLARNCSSGDRGLALGRGCKVCLLWCVGSRVFLFMCV